MGEKAKKEANVRELLEAIVMQLNEINAGIRRIEVFVGELRRFNDNFEKLARHLVEKGIITRAR